MACFSEWVALQKAAKFPGNRPQVRSFKAPGTAGVANFSDTQFTPPALYAGETHDGWMAGWAGWIAR
jgi:hypothetical protein